MKEDSYTDVGGDVFVSSIRTGSFSSAIFQRPCQEKTTIWKEGANWGILAIVFGCFGGRVPWDFGLEREWDALLEKGYAHFACVGRAV
jgi:hypothetical protein